MLLHKLQGEADLALERQWNEQQQEGIRLAATQPTKAEQCRKKLFQPRAETAQIQMELDLRKQLEAESQRNLQPRMNLRDANRTPADKKAQAEEPRRGEILFSPYLAREPPRLESDGYSGIPKQENCRPFPCRLPALQSWLNVSCTLASASIPGCF